MNESDTDAAFENLLKGLPPAQPSALLTARVEQELELDAQWLSAAPRRRVTPRWFAPVGWSALGAAAAVAVMSLLAQPAAPSSPAAVATVSASPSVMPVSTIRELVDAQDQGIRYNAKSHLPEQHVKYVTVERHAWIDPRDGAEITVEVPHEDRVILPVSFQ
ncbi:MAG TPA: hypothetical protein VD994_13330 [Prosthecobacter sp.]|nr:hypothetical protein [Prosthecobacter sp.]